MKGATAEADVAPRHARPEEPTTTLSFDEYYRRSYAEVARALAGTLGDRQLAIEAADEAMARTFANWTRVSRYDNPAGWSYRVGLNWARSFGRRLSRSMPFHERRTDELGPMADPELHRALLALPVKYRAVVVCRFLLDWSVDQTAEALDINPGTVKSRLSRGLTQLERRLSRHEEFE